jgi:osmotically-inducible protein OsmY
MLTSLPQHSQSLHSQTREVVERAEAVMRDVRELQGTPVFCRFDNGTLSLHGRVHSFHAKQLAQTAAADVPGISRVQNDLEVIRRR